MTGVNDTADADFSLDDMHCVKCGGELDTGFECNDCGFDMLPYVQRLQPNPLPK